MAVTSGLSIATDARDSAVLQRPRSSWALSWPLALGLVLFVWLPNSKGLLADPDSHWHITVGNWILAHGAVPTVDSFSFTFAGQPWIAKEWLSQVLLALAYNAGGWGAVAVLCAAAIGFAFALMMRLLLRDIRPLPALLFTVAAAVMTAPHLLARPHVLAFPFMLIWVAGLVRAVEERRARGRSCCSPCWRGPTCMAASLWDSCCAAPSPSRPWLARAMPRSANSCSSNG